MRLPGLPWLLLVKVALQPGLDLEVGGVGDKGEVGADGVPLAEAEVPAGEVKEDAVAVAVVVGEVEGLVPCLEGGLGKGQLVGLALVGGVGGFGLHAIPSLGNVEGVSEVVGTEAADLSVVVEGAAEDGGLVAVVEGHGVLAEEGADEFS